MRTQTVLLMLSATVTAVTAQTNTQRVPIDPKVAGLVKQAASAAKLHHYPEAIRTLSAALQMRPDPKTASAIYSWRAHHYYETGELTKAMSDANESILLNPRYYGGYLNRGIAYRRTGNLDQAISDYNTAIRLNPNFAWTYYDRALAYSLKGDYNAAIRDNTEAIRRQDRVMQADFFYNRGVCYQALGTLDKAMADYNEAIRLAPKDFRNYCGRASAFEDMGQLDKARADHDQVTRLNPTDAADYRMRGTAYFAKGNYQAAASNFEEAARISPSDFEALNSLAWFQATCPEDSLRNGKEALEKSLRVCEQSRWQNSESIDTLAAAYAELGDFDRAIKYETQAINMRGVHAFKRKRMEERLELYRQHKPYRQESKLNAR